MEKDKKYCINCGKKIPKTATFCPYCSAWQEDALPAPEQEDGSGDEKKPSGTEDPESGFREDEDSPLEGTYTMLSSKGGVSRSPEKKKMASEQINGSDGKEKEESEDSRIRDLEEMAYRDQPTHLYNRQKLAEDSKKIKTESICAIISIDINDLKHTNDTYGHEKGDQLIGNMANVLRRLVPDKSYRTGGDEFLVLIPGGTKDSADKLVTNIRSMLDELRENPDNGFVPVAAMGVAEKKPGETYEQAFQTADALMYENKKQIKSKRGRRATDRIQTAAAKDGINRQNTSDSITEGIRLSEEKRAEREMKEHYYAKKAAYSKMVAGRTGETVFFGILLVIVIVIRARIG